MKIQLIDLTVRELVAGYRGDGEGGEGGDRQARHPPTLPARGKP